MSVLQVIVLVLGILAVTGAALMAVFYPVIIRPQRATKALLASGTPATAVIRSFRNTGRRVNGRVMLQFELDVTTPTGQLVPAVARAMYDATYGRMREGLTLPVTVDPTDPTQVAIDWERWISDPRYGTGD